LIESACSGFHQGGATSLKPTLSSMFIGLNGGELADSGGDGGVPQHR
jgi:hypothetical protein